MQSIWMARINPLLQKIRFKEFGDNHLGRTFKTCTVIGITQANLKIGLKVASDILRPLIVQ